MMACKIIDCATTQTLVQLFKVSSPATMYDSKEISFDEPPYVRVGNLFLTTIVSGPTSWEYIATKVYPKDKIVVLAGRHGNIINPIDNKGRLSATEEAGRINDPADSKEDLRTVVNVKKINPNVSVIDVRFDAFRITDGLQAKISEYLKNGVVITSWCYGIYTMQTSAKVKHREDISAPNHSEHARFQKLMDTKISDLVKQDWSWALGLK